MADPEFRRSQLDALYAPHVKALNKLVDELRVDAGRWVPHVAPMHGGVEARVLLLGGWPGPARVTAGRPYDALLSVEDDQPGAARLGALLRGAGIEVTDTTPWNTSPWYADQPPGTRELRAGQEPLRRVLELTEHLQVLVLLGDAAERGWRMFASTRPEDTGWFAVLTAPGLEEPAGTLAERHAHRQAQQRAFADTAQLAGPPGRP
jgi:hypothetical protein